MSKYAQRTAPQLFTRQQASSVPPDPIGGDCYFQAFVGRGVIYTIFVYNPQPTARYFTFYDAPGTLDRREAIIFPWEVPGRSGIEIDFPEGLVLHEGMSCFLSQAWTELEVDAGETMRVAVTGRVDRDQLTSSETDEWPGTP